MTADLLRVTDLGRLPYEAAYQLQVREVERVLADRAAAEAAPDAASPPVGTIFLVEHDPVITITPRQSAMANLLATPEILARAGVQLAQTDRGGDITYHGPGQLVVYPILDLNRLNLRLHAYMRLLEQAVIDTCRHFGIESHRDPTATGVWVLPTSTGLPEPEDAESERPLPAPRGEDVGASPTGEGLPFRERRLGSLDPAPSSADTTSPSSTAFLMLDESQPAKIAAMGVRVRKWISMHGLALNVTTNLDHFNLIVPCGLAGRAVTSLQRLLGPACPSMPAVNAVVVEHLARLVRTAQETALAARGPASS